MQALGHASHPSHAGKPTPHNIAPLACGTLNPFGGLASLTGPFPSRDPPWRTTLLVGLKPILLLSLAHEAQAPWRGPNPREGPTFWGSNPRGSKVPCQVPGHATMSQTSWDKNPSKRPSLASRCVQASWEPKSLLGSKPYPRARDPCGAQPLPGPRLSCQSQIPLAPRNASEHQTLLLHPGRLVRPRLLGADLGSIPARGPSSAFGS